MIFSPQLRAWARRIATIRLIAADPREGAEVLLSLTNGDPKRAIEVAMEESASDPHYWRSIIYLLQQHPLYDDKTGPAREQPITKKQGADNIYLLEKNAREMVKVTVEVDKREVGALTSMLQEIRGRANVGHSFSVEVDPEDPEGGGRYFFDGDGCFYMGEIEVNGEEAEEPDAS